MSNEIDWPSASRFAGPQESPGFMLWLRFHEWQRGINQRLAPFELTQLQFSVLSVAAWLARDEKLVIQQTIADLAGLDRMLVSHVVRKLEAKKLLRRKPNGNDRRSFSIVLTRVGAALLGKTLRVVEAYDAQFFSERTTVPLPVETI
jgi:DNA-binding MarR family transcriptional regulator